MTYKELNKKDSSTLIGMLKNWNQHRYSDVELAYMVLKSRNYPFTDTFLNSFNTFLSHNHIMDFQTFNNRAENLHSDILKYEKEEKSSKTIMNNKKGQLAKNYPALYLISGIYKFSAFLTILSMLILIFKPEYYFGEPTGMMSKTQQVIYIIILGIGSSLTLFAISEAIKLLLEIGYNTRQNNK